MRRIGLISDTHGLLRPEASAFLRGCERIIHAGDIGSEALLQELATIAPTTAVRGNNDTGAWAARLPETQLVRADSVLICVIHDLAELDLDPVAAGVSVVVSGHSHKPLVGKRGGILYVNPGSAGPRRFSLPIALGEILVEGRSVKPRIIELEPPAAAAASRGRATRRRKTPPHPTAVRKK
ncbi:MAG: metallophosphoesterase family protein [Gammaproteobacteria bacterium]|nr:metallophosphoesterase family protein [Gammaproteobacteria bacterium]